MTINKNNSLFFSNAKSKLKLVIVRAANKISFEEKWLFHK